MSRIMGRCFQRNDGNDELRFSAFSCALWSHMVLMGIQYGLQKQRCTLSVATGFGCRFGFGSEACWASLGSEVEVEASIEVWVEACYFCAKYRGVSPGFTLPESHSSKHKPYPQEHTT